MKTSDTLRGLPSVDRLLQHPATKPLLGIGGHQLVVQALREVLDGTRAQLSTHANSIPDDETLIALAKKLIQGWLKPSLVPVINATGIILHTNLGRAPLSADALRAVEQAAQGYSNLEFDLAVGKRGSRLVHSEALLKRLLQVESAMVVNNNAGAVLLVLSALARAKQVAISRSQLVEIGGGFRVPDVMRQSGARLIEIGTTNRVHLQDYQNAVDEGASLILCAHSSNFKIIGFTAEPAMSEIASAAHARGLPLVYDIGSGALLDTARFGLAHEPTVQEALADGTDLVCFSGDKLLGGPQAGIIVGRANLLEKIKRHPLARALRADKLCLAALQATLLAYMRGNAENEIPVWRMIGADLVSLQTRAQNWKQALGIGEVVSGFSMVGGGSLPEESLPSALLALDVRSAKKFLAGLRTQNQPIIARVDADRVLFDPRTVLPEQDELFISILIKLIEKRNKA